MDNSQGQKFGHKVSRKYFFDDESFLIKNAWSLKFEDVQKYLEGMGNPDVRIPDDDQGTYAAGRSILMMASIAGKNDIVNLLLDYGASIDYVNKKGSSALSMAEFNGHYKTVKLLLDRGANINNIQKTYDMNTTKNYVSCHRKIAEILIDYGVGEDVVKNREKPVG